MKRFFLLLMLLLFSVCRAEEASLRISEDFLSYKGRVTLYWQDDAGAAPYTVTYQYVGETLDAQAVYIEEGIGTQSVTLDYLAPGGAYRIAVTSSAGDRAETVITLPPPGIFADGKLTADHLGVGVVPCSRPRDSEPITRRWNTLNGEAMAEALDGTEYGVQLDLSYPELARDRAYTTMIVFRGPGGFTCVYNLGEVTYIRVKTPVVYMRWPFIGGAFFDTLYQTTGSIGCGEYTVQCYWDGMLMGEASFQIN